jgi:hypothetical protein
MSYSLKPLTDGSFKIVREDDGTAILGFANPCGDAFGVFTPAGGASMMKDRIVDVVCRASDAIPSLTYYFEHHPENWEDNGYKEHTKFTPYGRLYVTQDRDGKWWAYRGGAPLCRRAKTGKRSTRPLTFRTQQEAQDAADKYVSNWSALCGATEPGPAPARSDR